MTPILPPEIGPRRILLVDDEPLILRAVKRSLAMSGLEVSTATDPHDGLAILERQAHDVVVSDLHMPQEDGACFLTEVSRRTPQAIRILMSADLEFRPRMGKLSEARVHALLGKAEMARLSELVIAQLEARFTAPKSEPEVTSLARRFARSMARPRHEDDAHRDVLARLTGTIATRIGLSSSEILDATLGAILHDVGQMTIPERVFSSPASLAPPERDEIEVHPERGAWLVEGLPALRRAACVVRGHHTRKDGGGYPAGADAAPAAARVLHVVDAYDAMRRGRHYAAPRSHADAIAELERNEGTQLDADFVRAFASLGEQPGV